MNATEIVDDPYPFRDFAPTLSQCFVIVIVGYLIARFELLNSNDVKGVNAFAAYFAMPGIICISLADANFDDFRWELLISIFLGKLLIFFVVTYILLFLNGNGGVAGTVAIFCVQSNDLPVGNPLMSSLYRNHRSQMMKYLFLIPAMTVIFFVPIGNIMINAHRRKRKDNQQLEAERSKKNIWEYICKREHLNHIYELVKNPVVIATFLGLVLNFVFKGNVPEVLHQPIKVAAATIPGIALAILGFSFVRKERYLISSAVIPAMVLLIMKMVLTPVILHSILKILTEGSESSKLLSDFALLYGIISPATAVFQSGSEFKKPLAAMSVALIITSLSCFPVSYVIARITIAPVQKFSNYVPQMKHILFWTACTSIFSDIFVWITMIQKIQWRQAPYCYIMYLVLTQCLTACGVLFWSFTGCQTWATYYQMIFYYGGEISGNIWTGTLALKFIYQEKYSMIFEKRFSILSFASVSVPVLITSVMCVLIPRRNVQSVYVIGYAKCNFEFIQLIMTTILLFISMFVVSVCSVNRFKRRKRTAEIADAFAYENRVFYIEVQNQDLKVYNKLVQPNPVKQQEKLGECEETKFYYQEMLRNSGCESCLLQGDSEWTNQLLNFLLIQGLVMFVRFIANLFKLTRSKALEIMIPMEFLQSVLFIGQGVFLLFTFGVDVRTITISIRKWVRKIRRGKDESAPTFANADEKGEVTQFYNFYFTRCFRELAKERRWKNIVYKDSFWGHQFVDWLISEGLCKDDTEAEEFGQKLLVGGVFRHVMERHHFYDAPYLYYFTRRKSARNLSISRNESKLL